MSGPLASGSHRFEISVERERALIRYRMTGFWDEEIFAQFHQAILLEMRDLQALGKPFDLIGDQTDFPPQSQALNAAREKLVQEALAMGLRRCGVVTSNSIVRMQLGRLSNNVYRFFVTEAEAMDWIEA